MAAFQASLNRIESKLNALTGTEGGILVNTQNLVDQVAKNGTVVGSALVLIQGMAGNLTTLSQQLKDAIASGDPVALAAAQKAIDDSAAALSQSDSDLAAAVAANTVPVAA